MSIKVLSRLSPSIVILAFLLLCNISCRKKVQEELSQVQKLESLCELSTGDTTTLAIMLNTSRESIEECISDGFISDENLSARINEIFAFSSDNNMSFAKVRAQYDPDFAWYDHILQSPKVHPAAFWVITGLLLWFFVFRRIILGAIRHSSTFYSDGLWSFTYKLSRFGLIVEGIVFLIAYLFSIILK